MKTKTFALALLAAVGSTAFSQTTSFSMDGRPERLFHTVSGLDKQDIQFIKMAQIGNQFEIEAAKVAETNGESDFVKAFAKQMVADHSAAREEILRAEATKSFKFTVVLPKELETKLNKLRALHGAAFDNAYRAGQSEAHAMTIQLFKSEIADGRDQDVKTAAVMLLPTVEMHATMLRTGNTMMGG